MSTGSKTLLDIVKAILDSMKSDNVNSINDTEEATSVAEVVRDTYDYMLASMPQTDHMQLFELDAGGPQTPTLMFLPSNADTIDWVKYNNKQDVSDPYPSFTNITFIDLQAFLGLTYQLPRETDSSIGTFTRVISGSAIEVYFRRDKHPTYCALLDDRSVLFDSYNQDYGSNLTNQNSLAFGKVGSSFQLTDTFVIPFNRMNTQLLLQDAKSQCFMEFRQIENSKAERRARNLRIRSQNYGSRSRERFTYGSEFDDLPHFGRKK